MKRVNIFRILSAVVMIALISSCKKGENDPGFSLRTRKARLCGEWTLTKEVTHEVENGFFMTKPKVTTTHTSLSGGLVTGKETVTIEGVSVSDDIDPFVKTTELSIKKDGTFEIKLNDDGEIINGKGNWSFVAKNKSLKIKNKEMLMLNVTSYSGSDSDGEVFSSTISGYGYTPLVYSIDRLANKEMVLVEESSDTNSEGKVNSSSIISTYTAK